MKKYILLIGERYYPNGWKDFRGSFQSIGECYSIIKKFTSNEDTSSYYWFEIINTESEELILSGDIEDGEVIPAWKRDHISYVNSKFDKAIKKSIDRWRNKNSILYNDKLLRKRLDEFCEINKVEAN